MWFYGLSAVYFSSWCSICLCWKSGRETYNEQKMVYHTFGGTENLHLREAFW
jgi:hypothetical protein